MGTQGGLGMGHLGGPGDGDSRGPGNGDPGVPGDGEPVMAVLSVAPQHPAAAQMVITDLTAPEERPAALGRLGLCFGVGVILGSLLGGTLSTACG